MTLDDWEEGRSVELARGQVLTVLTAIADGWQAATGNDSLTASLGEREVTRWLIGGMRRTMGHLGVTVARGTETPEGNVPDICISFQKLREEKDEHEPHVVVECKRVAGDDSELCRLYVRKGMSRFKERKYGKRRFHGFMVGYLMSGSGDEAVEGINVYLVRHWGEADCLKKTELSTSLAVWQSRHSRPAEQPIEVMHQFFAFRQTHSRS